MNSAIGKIGEDIACQIIERKNKGVVLFRNYRNRFGEVDIIFKDKYRKIVFLEVKTLTNKNVGQFYPEDNVTYFKKQKMKKIASWFANENSEIIDQKIGWQIDVVAIVVDIEKKNYKYRYYENVN